VGNLNVTNDVWYKVITNAAGEPANYSWSDGLASSIKCGGIACYRGVDNFNPINIYDTDTGESNSPTTPAITTYQHGCQLILTIAQNNVSAVHLYTPPTNFDEEWDLTKDSDGCSCTMADRSQTSGGGLGQQTFTTNESSKWVSGVIVLTPEFPPQGAVHSK